MILLYTTLLLFLAALKLVIDRRVRGLVKKHAAVEREAERLVKVAQLKQGNGGRPDAWQAAKRQYLLGRLVQHRDRVEARYDRWERRAERLKKLMVRLRSFKGRFVPYAFGVVDVGTLLYLLDRFGGPEAANVRHLTRTVAALFTK